uniref:Membrane protein containing HD superfamily hydrolase domain, YQFF ortholog n=1 Tax=uncultured Armatimonadetes bacterium TaxID=157466 RepID=A0A6J4K4U5_9BACT|nr:Membrane protein containing HD superfamily hydrolase domain, YQFF ortholog [uncultured Armatimonadetes bacterium]
MPSRMKTPLFQLPWRRKRRRGLSAARRRRIDGTIEAPAPWWLRISPARLGLAAGTAALLSLLLCIHLWPNRVSLAEGEIAAEEIVAQRTVPYEDTAETRMRRDTAAAQVPAQYNLDPDAPAIAAGFVGEAYDALDRAAARGAKRPGARALAAREIEQRLNSRGLQEALVILLEQGPAARQAARRASAGLVERAMSRRITDDRGDLERARDELSGATVPAGVPPQAQAAAVVIAAAALRPNQLLDRRETERKRESARQAVPEQMRRLFAGSVVIRPGERVTQQHLDKFTALGMRSPRLDARTAAAVCVMVVLLVVLVAAYLSLFHRALYEDTARLLLLAILTLFSVVGLKVGSTLLGMPFSGVHFGYLGMMCVASAGMAIALLLSPGVATLIVALLSVASGLILNNELRFTVITLGSSLVGIVSVATLRNRGDLIRAMVQLCGANVSLICLVGLLEGDTARELGTGALWGVISGLFALALFWLGVAVFEKPFGITTHLRLLELSDPATPILQEFRMRVPGTYAHSLMVGNLAHAAAEAIGADALLVRVAAYYHDLGKMNRPEFFIENQANAENIHDRLNPSLSALVLTSHVKEGLAMAEEVGLPPRVCEVIQQHHGTSLMKYFYHRATGGAQDATLEAQFRYAGPKPQSKEAAILMLADSVEAASRTLDKPTPPRIADFVARMVEDKRADGQLDDSDLTLRDLKRIQDVFARMLSGTLHGRIEYPGSVTKPRPPLPTVNPVPVATFPEEALREALTTAAGDCVEKGANGNGRTNGNAAHGDNGSDGAGTAVPAGGTGADRGAKAPARRR